MDGLTDWDYDRPQRSGEQVPTEDLRDIELNLFASQQVGILRKCKYQGSWPNLDISMLAAAPLIHQDVLQGACEATKHFTATARSSRREREGGYVVLMQPLP